MIYKKIYWKQPSRKSYESSAILGEFSINELGQTNSRNALNWLIAGDAEIGGTYRLIGLFRIFSKIIQWVV